ncbi:MAG: cytochrome c-type biogenesis protein CcmH [Arenicella sp.]|nr:cytochrome c-type biogenesis protein CcmH [Arenicella sp.]
MMLLASACILAWTSSHGVIEAVEFEDPVTEQRYQDLIAELRCLVCQNQNLADSDAALAKDLRRKTAEMLRQGMSDQEILGYMSERYGDFVLYRPQFTAVTALLWVGPFVLLAFSVWAILVPVRRRQAEDKNSEVLDEDQRKKIKDLLEGSPDLNTPSDSKE